MRLPTTVLIWLAVLAQIVSLGIKSGEDLSPKKNEVYLRCVAACEDWGNTRKRPDRLDACIGRCDAAAGN